jgi:hypothetical protein
MGKSAKNPQLAMHAVVFCGVFHFELQLQVESTGYNSKYTISSLRHVPPKKINSQELSTTDLWKRCCGGSGESMGSLWKSMW